MDRSFLSQKEVVAASRSFVCIRLATYESKEEAKLLESIFIGGSGQLENTVFAILTPDGTRKIVRAGRGPHFAFYGATDMAETMHRISREYAPAGAKPAGGASLPVLGSLRLGLNVAACDNLPLVVTYAADAAQRKKLEETLTPVAWNEAMLGRCIYAVSSDPKELKPIHEAGASGASVSPQAGYLVVAPDRYGQKGTVLARIAPTSDRAKLQAELDAALARYQPTYKDPRSHIAEGNRTGVHWETAIPVTDPGPRGGRPGFGPGRGPFGPR